MRRVAFSICLKSTGEDRIPSSRFLCFPIRKRIFRGGETYGSALRNVGFSMRKHTREKDIQSKITKGFYNKEGHNI